MARASIDVELIPRWWVPAVLRTLSLVCVLTGQAPDLEKVVRFLVRRGLRVRIR